MKQYIIFVIFFAVFFESLNSQSKIWQECSGPVLLYNISSMVTTSNNVQIVFGYGKIGRSTDNGNNWFSVQLYESNPGILISPTRLETFQNKVFAATYKKGVFKSVDGGINWIEMNNGLIDLDLNSIYINKIGTIFIGTMSGKIYKSVNDGNVWTLVGSVGSEIITSITEESGDIFVGSNHGIFRSTDNGVIWEKCDSSIAGVNALTMVSNGSILIGAENGIFRSTDYGTTWKSLLSSAQGVKTISVIHDSIIFIGKNNGVFKSVDNGESWTPFGLTNIYVGCISTTQNDYIFAGYSSNGVYRSNITNPNWGLLSSSGSINYGNGGIGELYTTLSGVIFARGEVGGLNSHRSTDNGEHWERINLVIFSLATNLSDTLFATSLISQIYRSTDSGINWELAMNGSGGEAASRFLGFNSKSIFIQTKLSGGRVTYDGSVYRSTDFGKTWINVGFGGANCPPNCVGTYIKNIFFSIDSTLFAIGNSNVYKSINNGTTWTTVNGPINGVTNTIYTSSKSNKIFAFGNQGVYRSDDTGTTWNAFNDGLPNLNIISHFIDKNGGIYVGSDSGVYYSSNEGYHWTKIGENTFTVYSLVSSDTTVIIANTNKGVFYYSSHVSDWTNFSNGLPTGGIASIVYNSQGHLFGLNSKHVYRTTLPVLKFTQVKNESAIKSDNFILEYNYPNPFNPETIISYKLTQKAKVQVDIFDILGNNIDQLINEEQESGFHYLKFDGTTFASGIYFYRIKVDGFVQTKKMLLLK